MNLFHPTCTTKFSSAVNRHLSRLVKLKGFYKGYFRHKKCNFTDNLTKIKSKLALNFLAFLLDPGLKNPAMNDR